MYDLEENTSSSSSDDTHSSSAYRLKRTEGYYTSYQRLPFRPLVLLRKRFGRCILLVVVVASIFLILIIITLVSFRSEDYSGPWYTNLPFFRRVRHATFDSEGNLVRHPDYLVFTLPTLPSGSSYPPSTTSGRPATSDRPVRGVRRLPSSCVEEYFAYGAMCRDGEPVKFDLVWTWVNGSDPKLEEAIAEAAKTQSPPKKDEKDPESKLYR
jgi:hypothetical protein